MTVFLLALGVSIQGCTRQESGKHSLANPTDQLAQPSAARVSLEGPSCLGLGPEENEAGTCQPAVSDQLQVRTPQSLNVLGNELELCSSNPVTGWFRDGYCRTDAQDRGSHTVCAEMSDAFLSFTRAHGNDLSTPRPASRFGGLKAGDRWCLCSARWLEAHHAGKAPKVVLAASHSASLKVIELKELEEEKVNSVQY